MEVEFGVINKDINKDIIDYYWKDWWFILIKFYESDLYLLDNRRVEINV